jgi:predicted dehydrogenase
VPENATNTDPIKHWQALKDNIAGRHETQLGEILDAMETNTPPPASGHDARRILEFIASVYKSAMTRQPVQCGEIQPDDPFYHAMNGSLMEHR